MIDLLCKRKKDGLGSFVLPGLCCFAVALAATAAPRVAAAQQVDTSTTQILPDAYSLVSAELVPEERELFDAFYGSLTAEGRVVFARIIPRLREDQYGSFGMLLTYAGWQHANSFLALFDSFDDEDFAFAAYDLQSHDYTKWLAIIELLKVEPVYEIRSEFTKNREGQCYAGRHDGIVGSGEYDINRPADARQCSEAVEQFRYEYNNSAGYVVNGLSTGSREANWQGQISKFGASTRESHTAASRRNQRRNYGKVLDDWEINHLCGAVYIGGRYLLTAAHCIGSRADSDFFPGRRVRLGSQRIDGLHNLLEIRTVVTHRNYNGTTFRNDIALIELTKAPRFSRLRAAKLPPRRNFRPPMSRSLLLTGWGFQQATRRAGDRFGLEGKYQKRAAPSLLKGELTLLPNSTCNAAAGELCAGTPTGRGASCRGDSGGPLVDKQTDILIGLVSHGFGCGLADKPATYVDVAYYLNWIKRAKSKARATRSGRKVTVS